MLISLADRKLALEPGAHVCMLYDEPDAQWPLLVPFLREGLDRGERAVYVADDAAAHEVRAALTGGGVDVDGALETGQLLLWSRADWRPGGGLDIPAKSREVRRLIRSTAASGFQGIRFGIEMTWASGPDIDAHALERWEHALNRVLAGTFPARMFCQYNRRRLPAASVQGALRTHPLATIGHGVTGNPFFTPHDPAEAVRDAVGAGLARDGFLDVLAHELRTPVSIIAGNASLLRSGRIRDTSDQEQALADVHDEAMRLRALLNDLLLLGRLSEAHAPHLEPVLLNRVITGAVHLFERDHGARIRVETPAEPIIVLGVAEYLETVLANLLTNARTCAPAGSEIKLQSIWVGDMGVITLLDRRAASVSPEFPSLSVEAFAGGHTNPEARGMRLGLAICRHLVELQGGRIWARPRPDGGSQVSFALPLISEPGA